MAEVTAEKAKRTRSLLEQLTIPIKAGLDHVGARRRLRTTEVAADAVSMQAQKPEGSAIVKVQQTHPTPRKYLELAQDVIVFFLCVILLVTMGIRLFDLCQLLIKGTDFALVVGDILFIPRAGGSFPFAAHLSRGTSSFRCDYG